MSVSFFFDFMSFKIIANFSNGPEIHTPRLYSRVLEQKHDTMTRSEAAITNGRLSKGPVTPEGKARSSQNARKHGLNSAIVVIEGESQAEFDLLLDSIIASHLPETPEEKDLILELAASRWRIRRCIEMEQALFEEAKDRLRTDKENPITDERIVHRKALVNVTDSSAMKQLHRYSLRLRRAAEKAEKEFQALKYERLQIELMWQKECADREHHESELAASACQQPSNPAAADSEPTEIATIASITPDGKIVYRYVEMPISEIRELQALAEAAEQHETLPATAAMAAAA